MDKLNTEEQQYLDRFEGRCLALVGMYGIEARSIMQETLNKTIANIASGGGNRFDPIYILVAEQAILERMIAELG